MGKDGNWIQYGSPEQAFDAKVKSLTQSDQHGWQAMTGAHIADMVAQRIAESRSSKSKKKKKKKKKG